MAVKTLIIQSINNFEYTAKYIANKTSLKHICKTMVNHNLGSLTLYGLENMIDFFVNGKQIFDLNFKPETIDKLEFKYKDELQKTKNKILSDVSDNAQIKVHYNFNGQEKEFNVDFYKDESVRELKIRVSKIMDCPIGGFYLTINGNKLDNKLLLKDCDTSGYIEYKPNSSMYAQNYDDYDENRTDYEEFFNTSDMCIFIKTLIGKTNVIYLNKNDSVEKLQQLIHKKSNIPLDQQRLVYAGRQIYDGKLCDHHIDNTSTLHLVLRLRGGMYHKISGRDGNFNSLTEIKEETNVFMVEPDL